MKIKALILIIFVIVLIIFFSFSIVSAIELNSSIDEYGESTQIICSDYSNFILSKQDSSYSHLHVNNTYFNNSTNFTLDEYGEIVPSDTVEKVKDSEIPYCNRTLPLDKFLNFVEDKGSCFKNYTISSLKNHGIIPDYNMDDYNITELQELGYSDEFIQQYLSRDMIDKTNFNDIVFWHIIAELDSEHHDKIAKQLYGEEPNKVTTKEKVAVIGNKTVKNLVKHGMGYVNCKGIAKLVDCVKTTKLNKLNAEIKNVERKISSANSEHSSYINNLYYYEHKKNYDWLETEDKVIHNTYQKNYEDMGYNTYQKYINLKHQISNGYQLKSSDQDNFWYQCQEAYVKFNEFKTKYDDGLTGDKLHEYIVTDYLNCLDNSKETCIKMKLYLLTDFIDQSRTEEVHWLNTYEYDHEKVTKKIEELTKQLTKLNAKKEKLEIFNSENIFTLTYTCYLGVKIGFDTILLSKNIDKHFIEHEPIIDWEMNGYFEYCKNRLIASLEY